MEPSPKVGGSRNTKKFGEVRKDMKVWWVVALTTFKDEARRKAYYEYNEKWTPLWQKKHEGVKFKALGGWSASPGEVVFVNEYESMEELAKVWSDEEIQKGLVKLRNHVKDYKTYIMRPTVSVN